MNVSVEVHHRFTYSTLPNPRHTENLLESTVDLNIEGNSFVSFTPEAVIMICCINMAKDFLMVEQHQVTRFACDMAALLRKFDHARLENMIGEAKRQGLLNALMFSYEVMSRMLNINFRLLDTVKDTDNAGLHYVKDVPIFADERRKSYFSSFTRSILYQINLHDERWRFLRGIPGIFRPRIVDYRLIRLPKGLRVLYYIISFLRMLIALCRGGPRSAFRAVHEEADGADSTKFNESETVR